MVLEKEQQQEVQEQQEALDASLLLMFVPVVVFSLKLRKVGTTVQIM